MEMVYSYIEGPIIASKFRHCNEDGSFIRTGICFPLDEKLYKSSFSPESDYCSSKILNYLVYLAGLVDEKRRFSVTKANVCYGSSTQLLEVEKMKGKEMICKMIEPISPGLHLQDLGSLCNGLKEKNKEVSLYRESSVEPFLSSSIPYTPLTEKFETNLDVMEIKIPKTTVGCRIEFVLPEEIYDTKKIEEPFDLVAENVKFGKKISELEKMHEEFLEMVERSREKQSLKVVKTVEV